MSTLSWIDDDALESCITELIGRIAKARDNASDRVRKNVPDPFRMLCLAHLYQITDIKDLLSAQEASSIATGVSSAVGNFHQNIIGSIDGFNNHDAGYDIESEGRKILAEIKNKHNTMNSDSRKGVKNKLKTILESKPDYTGYLVIIVPKKPKRYCTEIGRRLYEIDGASFYAKVTGNDTALEDLHKLLLDRLCSHAPEITDYIIGEYAKSFPV